MKPPFRAGGFEPLRFLPRGKKRAVLGLVSSTKPDLERSEDLMRRIEAASKFAPLEQLALRRMVEVAGHIWGSA